MITIAQPVTAEALSRFIAQIQEIHNVHMAKMALSVPPDVISFTEGPKYIRVIHGNANGTGRSVYCFVDKATGSIYKAASWLAPEKNHVRGNIHDVASVEKWCGPYGPSSLK